MCISNYWIYYDNDQFNCNKEIIERAYVSKENLRIVDLHRSSGSIVFSCPPPDSTTVQYEFRFDNSNLNLLEIK